ncbi:MAG: TolC family protein [Thiohalomonadales bacterium]
MSIGKAAVCYCFIILTSNVDASTSPSPALISLDKVIQAVVDYYPSIKIASLQVDKVSQNAIRIRSRLGWNLNAGAGVSNYVGFTGSTVNQGEVGASVTRTLSWGDQLSFDAKAIWEDSERPFFQSFSNPGTVSSAGINYRHPLQQGKGNVSYHLALQDNEQNIQIARASLASLYNGLARQITFIYFSAAQTLSRLDNVRQSISRTRRLQKFINNRFSLGIAEDKDKLQVDAEYKSQVARLKALDVIWIEQQIALNRLMGIKWDKIFITELPKSTDASFKNFTEYLEQIKHYDPQLRQINAQIQLATNNIQLRREKKRNNMDIVMHFGQQKRSTDITFDGSDYSEVVGGLKLEYKNALDKTGSDAAIFQSQLDRDAALQQKYFREQELHYDVASLLAELKAARLSTHAYLDSVKTERAKLTEADERYKRGRIDVDLLLKFETQLSIAQLAYSLQTIDVARREYVLLRLRGEIWRSISLPAATEIFPEGSQLQKSSGTVK